MRWYCYHCEARTMRYVLTAQVLIHRTEPLPGGDFLIDLEDAREEDKEEELLQLPSTPTQWS